jgi:microcin C transport system permease protein
MVVNFALTQFVPGGPVEQVLAQLEGEGDVFAGISGGGNEAWARIGDRRQLPGRARPAAAVPR